MRSIIARAVCPLAAALVAACGGPSSALRCGAGTVEKDGECVAAPADVSVDAAVMDSSTVDAAPSDGGADARRDSGPLPGEPRLGDPCDPDPRHVSLTLRDQCFDTRAYTCSPRGVVVLDVDCAVLGGACVPANSPGSPLASRHCEGGPNYTTCSEPHTRQFCRDDAWLRSCSVVWRYVDCSAQGRRCVEPSPGTARCALADGG